MDVTKEDCDAAAAYWAGWSSNVPEHDGEFHPLVLLLAQHRTQALTTAQSEAAELRKEVERLRGAVRAADDAVNDSREGWENAVELGLLPAQHHATAKKLQEQCWKAARDIRAALTSGPTT